MSINPAEVAVALLGESSEAAAPLHAAIEAMGGRVVYEAPVQSFDQQALDRSGANVVVVNLGHPDADLDAVQELIHSPDYRVIFNDSDVSGALTGWDHARWLRHLAAKIVGGSVDLHPPRPPGAEPVPMRTTPAANQAAEEAVEIVPAATGEISHAADDGRMTPVDAAIDVTSLIDPVAGADSSATAAMAPDGLALDWSAFDAPPALPGSEPTLPTTGTLPRSGDPDRFDFLTADAPPHQGADLTVGGEQAVGDAGIDWIPDAEVQSLDPTGIDLNFDLDTGADITAPMTELERTTDVVASAEPASIVVPDWTLEDVLLDVAEPPASPPAASDPSEFGIETVRAADFLAPSSEGDAAQLDAVPSRFTLELIPIEEVITPTPFELKGRESWMEEVTGVPSAVQIRQVWVLCASVGGPEAVREFLADLPSDYPALFLLAQHLGDEFVDMMASQLAKATPLTVRVPQHGERASHGEVLIVPSSHRLRVDAAGVVVLERAAAEGAYSPSIDQVLQDCADNFGGAAGAIVFSGMSDDAVEGCRYLDGKGGKVYVQRADTCVVSTMVDGVCETGVVSFQGSPLELAERLRGEAV